MSLTRRQTLGCAAIGATWPRLAWGVDAAPGESILAVHSFIWLQQMRARKQPPAKGLEDVFATAAAAGFKNMELMAFFLEPDVREKSLSLLRKNGLKSPIVYSGGPMHEPDVAEKSIERVLAISEPAKAAGAIAINCNPSPKPNRERKSDEELATQARALNGLGERLRAKGLRLFVHHHDPEMAENAREWRHILAHTDAALVSLCIDTNWVYFGGQDPLNLLREAGPRVASIHLRNSKQRIWMEEFGAGDVDYGQVAEYLRRSRLYPYLVVELAYADETKPTRSLEKDLRLSRVYAQKVFGL